MAVHVGRRERGNKGVGMHAHVDDWTAIVSLMVRQLRLDGDEEGQVFVVIFGRDARRHVVLLEVEQAACTKGMTTMALE